MSDVRSGTSLPSFWGPEAKLRHLPALRRSLQAVKSTCQAGVVKKCKSFFAALFIPLFLQMTASGPSSLSSRAELPVGIRRNDSGLYEDSEPGDLPSPWGLLTTDCDFSTPRRSRGNEKKTGRAAVSIRSLSMKDGASAVWSFNHLKGTLSFFHSPCILRQRRRHPLRLMNPGRRAALQSQICHFNSIKSEVNFFNSTCWVKNELNETSTIKAGILTYELLR